MIPVNFASRNYRLLEGVRTGFAAANVLLAAGTVIIIWTVLSLRADLSALDGKVKEIAAAEEQIRPLLAERDRVVKDLSTMSGLIESRRFSWTRLLTDIEKAFPVGVALHTVAYNRRDRSLALDGSARSPESLRNLMIGLEGAPVFKEPYLRNQSDHKGSIFFNVAAYYQENNAAGVAQAQ